MKLANNIIVNTDITSEELAMYAGLRLGFRDFSTVVEISSNFLWYLLTGNDEISNWQQRVYQIGIQRLSEKGLIDIIKESKQTKFVTLEKMKIPDDDRFTRIEEFEYKKILNYRNSKLDIELLRLFFVVMATTSKNGLYQVFTGKTSQEYQCSLIPMSYPTYLKNYKTLETELELIHTFRPNTLRFSSGQKIDKGVPNTYGRHRDAVYIDKIGQEDLIRLRQENPKSIKKMSKGVNQNRSASQIYFNWIGGKDYSEDVLVKTYFTLLELNKRYYKDYEKKERIKDLTKFKEFNFYEGEGIEYGQHCTSKNYV